MKMFFDVVTSSLSGVQLKFESKNWRKKIRLLSSSLSVRRCYARVQKNKEKKKKKQFRYTFFLLSLYSILVSLSLPLSLSRSSYRWLRARIVCALLLHVDDHTRRSFDNPFAVCLIHAEGPLYGKRIFFSA